MEAEKRIEAVTSFAILLAEYGALIKLRENTLALSKSVDGFDKKYVDLLNKSIDTQRGLLLALYETALL